MAFLPRRPNEQTGNPFAKLTNSVNDIIDYLQKTRLVAGHNVKLRETSFGTSINADGTVQNNIAQTTSSDSVEYPVHFLTNVCKLSDSSGYYNKTLTSTDPNLVDMGHDINLNGEISNIAWNAHYIEDSIKYIYDLNWQTVPSDMVIDVVFRYKCTLTATETPPAWNSGIHNNVTVFTWNVTPLLSVERVGSGDTGEYSITGLYNENAVRNTGYLKKSGENTYFLNLARFTVHGIADRITAYREGEEYQDVPFTVALQNICTEPTLLVTMSDSLANQIYRENHPNGN